MLKKLCQLQTQQHADAYTINANIKVIFKNYALFCIAEINYTQVDNAQKIPTVNFTNNNTTDSFEITQVRQVMMVQNILK